MVNEIFNFQIILIFIIGLFIHGCVIVPVPLPEKMVSGEKPDESPSFIEIGVTSKAEISDRLGPPVVIWLDENIFVYDWKARWGVWIVGVAIPHTVLDGDVLDINHHHFLMIQFDSNDRVKRYEKTTNDSTLYHLYGNHLIDWVHQGDKSRYKQKSFSSINFLEIPIPDHQRAMVQDGKLSLVLLRVTGEFEDGSPVEIFVNYPVYFSSFETGKGLRPVFPEFFSKEARQKGWSVFLLEPGNYRFAFEVDVFIQDGRSRIWADERSGRLWAAEIPNNSPVVYIGTMHLVCGKKSRSSVESKDCDHIIREVVKNEELEAKNTSMKYLPDFDPPKIVLMKEATGPFIVRTPESRKKSITENPN